MQIRRSPYSGERPYTAGAGSAAAPAYSFLSDTDTGDYLSSEDIYTSAGGTARLRRGVSGLILRPELPVAWTSAAVTGTPDLYLYRDAANTIAQRNGTTAQLLRVYNTYTDSDNYERFVNAWVGNDFYLETQHAGTGSARQMIFGTGNSSRWRINTSGHLLAHADNTYDIGASGATRPRDVYTGRNVTVGNNLTVGCDIVITAGRMQMSKGTDIASAGTITCPSNGNFFDVTGTTNINYMTTTGWQIGSVVSLRFAGVLNVNHNTGSVPADTAPFYNSSAANWATTANDILHVIYDGTYWHHWNRAVI